MQLWMHRISGFLFVLISAVAGVLLIILPWTPEWTDNYLLLSFPSLRTFVSSGFFRGICSGLGLLDIWIGFWEASTTTNNTNVWTVDRAKSAGFRSNAHPQFGNLRSKLFTT